MRGTRWGLFRNGRKTGASGGGGAWGVQCEVAGARLACVAGWAARGRGPGAPRSREQRPRRGFARSPADSRLCRTRRCLRLATRAPLPPQEPDSRAGVRPAPTPVLLPGSVTRAWRPRANFLPFPWGHPLTLPGHQPHGRAPSWPRGARPAGTRGPGALPREPGARQPQRACRPATGVPPKQLWVGRLAEEPSPSGRCPGALSPPVRTRKRRGTGQVASGAKPCVSPDPRPRSRSLPTGALRPQVSVPRRPTWCPVPRRGRRPLTLLDPSPGPPGGELAPRLATSEGQTNHGRQAGRLPAQARASGRCRALAASRLPARPWLLQPQFPQLQLGKEEGSTPTPMGTTEHDSAWPWEGGRLTPRTARPTHQV